MRIVMYGAGAVGGVIAARLALAGEEVALIARGAHGDAIRAGGLKLDSPSGRTTVDLPVAAAPAEMKFVDGDVVALGMKSQDTGAALGALAAVAPPTTPVVCLQNGVDNERAALRRFADVYAVPVMCPTGHLEPGVVQAFSEPVTGILDVGRYPAGTDDTVTALVAAFSGATFESVARPDVMRWKHAKLLMNLGNAIEAVCGPSARAGPLADVVKAEGVACLRAAGIDFASDEEDAARRGSFLTMARIGGQRRGGGSSWQSLERATGQIETDWLNGEIVLLGRLRGVPTPANTLMCELANELAAGRRPPGSIPADDVLARLHHRT